MFCSTSRGKQPAGMCERRRRRGSLFVQLPCFVSQSRPMCECEAGHSLHILRIPFILSTFLCLRWPLENCSLFYLDLAKGSLHAVTRWWLCGHSEVEDVTREGLMLREKSQNYVNGLENFISLLEVQYLFSKANSKSGWIKVFNLSKLNKSLSWNLEIPASLIEQLNYK